MEQQTVTIAKAGIHMSLNARCSVVAAANPIYGQYDTELSPHRNVALPDSLVSRFDLLFIVLDIPAPILDRKIGEKVIANHCYVGKAGEDDPFDDATLAKGKDESVYQKFDRFLHSHMKVKRGHGSGQVDILSIPFLKKYIHFAKEMYKPRLTEEASKQIGDAYSRIRNRENMGGESMPITVRALETLIRLSTAHAKAHLRHKIKASDVSAAVEILSFALENDAGFKGTQVEISDGTPTEESSKSSTSGTRTSPRKKRKVDTDVSQESSSPPAKRQIGESTSGRAKFFQTAMVNYMNQNSLYSSKLNQLIDAVNSQLSGKEIAYTIGEASNILKKLEVENKVMVRNEIVHRI